MSPEMLRRKVLLERRASGHSLVPVRLQEDQPDHLNADIWRAGLVADEHVGRP